MRSLTTLFAVTTVLCGQAQWAAPDVNTYIGGGSADLPMMSAGPDGSTYISWFENSSGQYKVRLQRVDVNGVAQWAANGIVVSDEPQGSALFRHYFSADNAGNALFAFQDERSGELDLVVYKVGPDGTDLWDGGVELTTPGGRGMSPRIAALSDNRVVVAWNGQTSPAKAMVQVLSAEGEPLFDEAMGMTTTGISGRPLIVPNSDGGFWLLYVHQTGNFLSPGTIKAKRFNAALEAGPEITVSDRTIAGFFFPEAVSDGLNGFYMGFNTGNAASANMTDVYVQRVRGNGTTWSTSGTAVEEGATTHRFNTGAQPTLLSGGTTVAMAYRVTNSSQSLAGVSLQTFDTAGVALNGPQATVVRPQSDAMSAPYGTFVMPEGLLIGFGTTAGFENDRLEAVHVNADGTVGSLGTMEVAVAGPSGKGRAAMHTAAADVAVVVFTDSRNDGQVYLQGIDRRVPMGVAGADAELPVSLLHGEQPELLFGGATANDLRMQLLDVQGRRISATRIGARVAGDRVLLPVDDLAPGTYAVLLESAGKRTVLRMVR